MQDSLFEQGVELMLYGMGTVFTFLALLVLVTGLMSKLLRRFIKPQPEPVLPRATAAVAATAADNNDQLIAVITAAVHKYRSRRK